MAQSVKDWDEAAIEKAYLEVVRKGTEDWFERETIEPYLDTFLKQHPNYAPGLRLRGLVYDYEVSRAISNNQPVAADDPR